MKHSPGPWKWVHNEYEYPNLPLIEDAKGDEVCNFGDDTEYYPSSGRMPNKADAALIAAAPDLLYASERALLILAALATGVMVDQSVINQSGKELKAAISKATEINETK